jgi:hypothetical protein
MDPTSQESGRSLPPVGVPSPASAETYESASRRSLLRAGVGVAPVLLTLTSRPVAAANSCVVASSFVSVATFRSRNPTTTSVQCATRTCEDWYRDACLPSTGTPSRPAFLDSTVASLLGSTTSGHNGSTLWAVLKNDPYGIVTAGQLGVLQHLIALTLNVQKGYTPSPGNLSVLYLQSVWQNYVANGGRYVLPASGVNWDSTQLISWLRMLMYPIVI